MERKTQEKKKGTESKKDTFISKKNPEGVNAIETPAGQKRRQLKSLKPNLPSNNESREKDRPNRSLAHKQKTAIPCLPKERERDTNLGSGLEGKRGKEGNEKTKTS